MAIKKPTLSLRSPAAVSLAKKPSRTGPITAPLPTGPIPGAPLSVEEEATADLQGLAMEFASPLLDEAEGRSRTRDVDKRATFEKKKAREKYRRDIVSETTYFGVLVFACTEDLNVFLDQLGVPLHGQYLDGYAVAERLGFTVPRTKLPEPNMSPLTMWEDLALDVEPARDPELPADFDPAFE